jgi:predicted O-methyltransferase YrrM
MGKLKYLRHQLNAKHTKGFNVHSPFMYHFINGIIYEKHPYYVFSDIEKIKRKLLQNKNTVHYFNPQKEKSEQISIASYAEKYLQPTKYDRLLFRTAHCMQAKNIIETGTMFGITSMYLAAVSSAAKCTSFEENDEIAAVARETIGDSNIKNITVKSGNISENLKEFAETSSGFDFVFFGNDYYLQMDKDVQLCLEKSHNETVFVLKNIHQSKEINSIWEMLIAHPQTTSSIDMYHFGIVFFKKMLEKRVYKIKF